LKGRGPCWTSTRKKICRSCRSEPRTLRGWQRPYPRKRGKGKHYPFCGPSSELMACSRNLESYRWESRGPRLGVEGKNGWHRQAGRNRSIPLPYEKKGKQKQSSYEKRKKGGEKKGKKGIWSFVIGRKKKSFGNSLRRNHTNTSKTVPIKKGGKGGKSRQTLRSRESPGKCPESC